MAVNSNSRKRMATPHRSMTLADRSDGSITRQSRAAWISAARNAPLAAQQPKGVANLTLGLGRESVVAGERQQKDEPDGSPEGGSGRQDADRVHDVWAS
jgi:hypothetical protein